MAHSCCWLPGRVMAKVLCHCISENFCFLRSQWGRCRMFCVTQVSIGAWVATCGFSQYFCQGSTCSPAHSVTFQSDGVTILFSHHFTFPSWKSSLLVNSMCLVFPTYTAFSSSVKICRTSVGTLQSRKFAVQPQWKVTVHALCPHR